MGSLQLFSKYDVFALVNNSLEDRVKKEVNSLNSDHILKITEDDLVAYVLSKMELRVPTLRDDAIHFDQQEVQVDARRFPRNQMFMDSSRPHYVPGTRVRVRIPFDGDPNVFHVRPSSWSSAGYPVAEIIKNEIILIYEQEVPDGAEIKKLYLGTLAEIKKYLASLANSFDGFNQQIQPIIRRQLNQRRETLISATNIGDALGLPQRQTGKEAITYPIDLKKRERPVINLPPTETSAGAEPVLAQGDYEYVLQIMKLMSQTMERSSRSLSSMDEEAIRDLFLVHINAQYQGGATGETFNFNGKTDILLKVDGKCVFIAECKFWTGEKGLLETIDQLLGYLSWRDTKVAVIVLNRNKSFTQVLQTIQQGVSKHKFFIRHLGVDDETTFRYEFCQSSDENRKIHLSVMAFNVPTR
jgi:hypothetical protein